VRKSELWCDSLCFQIKLFCTDESMIFPPSVVLNLAPQPLPWHSYDTIKQRMKQQGEKNEHLLFYFYFLI
jgi:hypothetical protein